MFLPTDKSEAEIIEYLIQELNRVSSIYERGGTNAEMYLTQSKLNVIKVELKRRLDEMVASYFSWESLAGSAGLMLASMDYMPEKSSPINMAPTGVAPQHSCN